VPECQHALGPYAWCQRGTMCQFHLKIIQTIRWSTTRKGTEDEVCVSTTKLLRMTAPNTKILYNKINKIISIPNKYENAKVNAW
jgi:hypothetical protein